MFSMFLTVEQKRTNDVTAPVLLYWFIGQNRRCLDAHVRKCVRVFRWQTLVARPTRPKGLTGPTIEAPSTGDKDRTSRLAHDVIRWHDTAPCG